MIHVNLVKLVLYYVRDAMLCRSVEERHGTAITPVASYKRENYWLYESIRKTGDKGSTDPLIHPPVHFFTYPFDD